MHFSVESMIGGLLSFQWEWSGLLVLAQADGAVAGWRAVMALLLVMAGLVVGVGGNGFLQRWLVGRRGELAAIAVFAVGLTMGALLWMAAWLLRIASSPGLGYETFRPFVQTVAHCAAMGIGVSVVLLPSMTLLDRWSRVGQEQALRGAGRLLPYCIMVVVVSAILYEPFLLATGSARPTSADFTIGLPFSEFFAGLTFLLIALAAMLPCVAAAHRAQRNDGRDREHDHDHGRDHHRQDSQWLQGMLPWVGVILCLPCSYLCYRLAVKTGSLPGGAARWINGLGGSSGQGELLHFVRWCVMYGITIIAAVVIGSRLMRLAPFNRQPQKPIASELGWLWAILDQLSWSGRGRKKKSKAGSKREIKSQRRQAMPASTGESFRANQSTAAVLPAQNLSALNTPAESSPVSSPDATPDPTPSQPVLPDAPPPVPPSIKARTPVQASKPRGTDAVDAQRSDSAGQWEALPIDPKTGMIREDVARQIERELERDAGLTIEPHGRRRSKATRQGGQRESQRAMPWDEKVDQKIIHAAGQPELPRAEQASLPMQPVEPLLQEAGGVGTNGWGFSISRWHVAVLLLIYAAMAYYASMVPLNYQPIEWKEAWRRLMAMEHFNVADNPNRRADFVANIALFVPIGFLGMAVLALGRRSKAVAMISSVVVMAGCSLLAWGIEFRQVWYPPRTVSQNDLVAEHLGSVIGIVLWLVFGHGVMSRLSQMIALMGTQVARHRLLQLYAVGLFFFCLLPMDFTLSPARILEKFKSISIGGDLFTGNAMALGRVLRDLAAFLPVGILACLNADRLPMLVDRESGKRSTLAAAVMVFVFVALIEFLKLFMVNGVVDLMNLPVRTLSGFLGAHVALRLLDENAAWRVAMHWPQPQRAVMVLTLAIIYAGIAVALLAPPWQVNWDMSLLLKNIQSMKQGLFINYYYAGEWTALTNLTHYGLLFVPLGLLLRWALHPRVSVADVEQRSQPGRSRWLPWLVPLVVGLLVGGLIEGMQGGLAREVVHITAEQVDGTSVTFRNQAIDVSDPSLSKGKHLETGPMPDITDLLAYMMGTCAGWLFMGLFLPVGSANSRRPNPPSF